MLTDVGANLDATASADAGGVPGGNALRHAAVFDMTGVGPGHGHDELDQVLAPITRPQP